MTRVIELTVSELRDGESGRGYVRIDEIAMREIGLSAGDIVEIEGRRRTVAIAVTGYDEDRGKWVIRMDPLKMRDAGVNAGEKVRVRKIEAVIAEYVRLKPVSMTLTADPNLVSYVKSRLRRRPLLKGDVLSIPLLGQEVLFEVEETRPEGPVVVETVTQVAVMGAPLLKTLLVAPTSVKLGGRVAVAGLAEYALPGSNVEIIYRKPSGSRLVRSVSVDEEGVFTDVITADELGAWIVGARVGGSTIYALFLVE